MMKRIIHSQYGMDEFILLNKKRVSETLSGGLNAMALSKQDRFFDKVDLTIYDDELIKEFEGNKEKEIYLNKGDVFGILMFHYKDKKRFEKVFEMVKKMFGLTESIKNSRK